MAYGRLIALATISAFLALLGCARAQAGDFLARDGRVVFQLSEGAARDAFDRFCQSQTQLQCDSFEAYDMMVRFDQATAELSFIHRSTTAPANLVLTFKCAHAAQDLACTLTGRS